MAVTVANVGTVAEEASGDDNSLPVSAPAGTGGVLVLLVTVGATANVGTPSNWNARGTISQANGHRASVFDRISDGGSDDSPTISAASGTPAISAGMLRLAGAHASDYFDSAAQVTIVDNSIDGSGDIPTFDVAEDGSLQIVIVTGGSAQNSVAWTSPLDNEQDVDRYPSFYSASAPRDAGTVSADTFTTGGSSRKAGVSVVYKPAEDAPPEGSASLSGVGTIAPVGARASRGSGSLTAVGSLAPAGARPSAGAASCAGVGSIAATGARDSTTSGTCSGIGRIAATGARASAGAATLSGVGQIVAIGDAPADPDAAEGFATLAGIGRLSPAGSRSSRGSVRLACVGRIVAVGNAAEGDPKFPGAVRIDRVGAGKVLVSRVGPGKVTVSRRTL